MNIKSEIDVKKIALCDLLEIKKEDNNLNNSIKKYNKYYDEKKAISVFEIELSDSKSDLESEAKNNYTNIENNKKDIEIDINNTKIENKTEINTSKLILEKEIGNKSVSKIMIKSTDLDLKGPSENKEIETIKRFIDSSVSKLSILIDEKVLIEKKEYYDTADSIIKDQIKKIDNQQFTLSSETINESRKKDNKIIENLPIFNKQLDFSNEKSNTVITLKEFDNTKLVVDFEGNKLNVNLFKESSVSELLESNLLNDLKYQLENKYPQLVINIQSNKEICQDDYKHIDLDSYISRKDSNQDDNEEKEKKSDSDEELDKP